MGSSGALPAYGRFPSAQWVEIQNHHFLIDCGEGTQMQLMKYQANFHRISHIFISHLHGDHYLGLMGLIFTMHLHHRANDLHVYSHQGLDEILTTQLRYSRSAPSFRIYFHRLEKNSTEVIFENDKFAVETIPLIHKVPCSGFLFREKPKPRRINKEKLPEGLPLHQIASLKKGLDVTDDHGNIIYRNEDLTLSPRKSRTYAYCSDTAFNRNMIHQIKNVDVLYHEATFTDEEREKAHETQHSTAREAAMTAHEANAGKLILGHFSARYRDLEPLLTEASQFFSNTDMAAEGKIYNIEDNIPA